MIFTIILLGFLLGSIPFGYLLTKIICKSDIRDYGSGNIGATNIWRLGHKFLAFATLLLDAAKGFIAVSIVAYTNVENPELIDKIVALAAVLGHILSPWMKFKGGKGIATYIGAITAINFLLGISFCAIWMSIFLLKHYSSLAAIIATITMPFLAIFLATKNTLIFTILMAIIILLSHRKNIIRLIKKQEMRIDKDNK